MPTNKYTHVWSYTPYASTNKQGTYYEAGKSACATDLLRERGTSKNG